MKDTDNTHDFPQLVRDDLFQVFLFSCPMIFPFCFVSHTWFVVNRYGNLSRWEVLYRKFNRLDSFGHIHKNLFSTFSGTRIFSFSEKYLWPAKLLSTAEGKLAEQMTDVIQNSPNNYPYRDKYRPLGPNCNTYTEWIARQFPTFLATRPLNTLEKRAVTEVFLNHTDYIPTAFFPTIPELFKERIRRSGENTAYTYFDASNKKWGSVSWNTVSAHVKEWQRALYAEGLQKGDCVAVRLLNCYQWVLVDQAALSLGLTIVPIHHTYREKTVAYILEQTNAKLLVLHDANQLEAMQKEQLPYGLERIVLLEGPATGGKTRLASKWLAAATETAPAVQIEPDDLSVIMFTSGTTGIPKGVMLSHRNVLGNAEAALRREAAYPSDVFLSILPFSTIIERTVGYLLPLMAGASVAFNRSRATLRYDMQQIRPTAMVSAPRLFEKLYAGIMEQVELKPRPIRKLFDLTITEGYRYFEYEQGRGTWRPIFLLLPVLRKIFATPLIKLFGGQLRFTLSGGAPLSKKIARMFVGLGVPILQGYGLTETSPILCANTLRENNPESVGKPLGNVQVCLNDNGELLAKGPNIMLGYLNEEQTTAAVIDKAGWLHTGDLARIDDAGFVYITSRLKEIIFLTDGSKVYPLDMEPLLSESNLIEQVMVVGNSRPFMTALVVPSEAGRNLSESEMLEQVLAKMVGFPDYALLCQVTILNHEWTVENDLLTPSLKLRRAKITQVFTAEIEAMYASANS